MTDAFDFTRYLAAKRSVDDRALNRHVWQTLADAVRAASPRERPLRVLEVGAGIGTMVERCVEWGLFTGADYSAIDSEANNIDAARQRLTRLSSTGEPGLRLRLQTANLYEFAARLENRQRFDLLIAHALLDLLHLPTALPSLLRMLRPGGLFYFSINFDGATLFQPEIDPALDRQIEGALPPLDGHARHGWAALGRQPHGTQALSRVTGVRGRCAGGGQLGLGRASGRWAYPADEAYFLSCILHFVESTLRGHSELDARAFKEWLAARRRQIARGELVYVAHQLDYCGRVD